MTEVATDTFFGRLQEFVGKESGPPRRARDPVNEPMIRHWCDAMGDSNPVYTDLDAAAESIHGGIVAPPTMLQAWTMPGLKPPRRSDEPTNMQRLWTLLDEVGFTSVVATNCEQRYERYLRPGDSVTDHQVIDDISPEKDTALGTGHFVTFRHTYTDQAGEVVGTMLFRVLKFRPAGATRALGFDQLRARLRPRRPRPAISQDTAFFWEGLEQNELRIQRCASCGTLRHPPRPMCGNCNSLDWGYAVSSGRGSVYSYVVHHHPPVPGMTPPFVVALVELEEGLRIVSNLDGVEPSDVRIGMPVEVDFFRPDPELVLHRFRRRSEG